MTEFAILIGGILFGIMATLVFLTNINPPHGGANP